MARSALPVAALLLGVLGGGALARRRPLDMSTEYFLVPVAATATTAVSRPPPGDARPPPQPPPPAAAVPSAVFRDEAWVLPVLSLAALSMLLIAGFEVFVLCKARRTAPSRRHLFLGQMLLLGLFACAGLGAVLALAPTSATCAAVRLGAGLSYALVFASLLVKCVFLISLNGGVYLPAPYQALLLLFAVLVQAAIGAQWLLTHPPRADHRPAASGTVALCRAPYSDLLLSLSYVLFLMASVAALAVKSRGIRDNYREATYIGLSVGCSIPIWLAWTLAGAAVADRHRDACLAFGLVATSAVVFLVMFMPKGRQLAAMGRDGVFLEDREDRFSSLSRTGSGYSPSFFHFKPASKYAGGGDKHHVGQAAATVASLGPDRAALYPAPPSYTPRMYHCYSSYYPAPAPAPRYPTGGVLLRPDDGNVYTTLEPTLSSNPNVYFQRGNGLHPGMMY